MGGTWLLLPRTPQHGRFTPTTSPPSSRRSCASSLTDSSDSMLTALHRLLVSIVLLPVVVYRRVLSPLKRTPSCRYLPTCSEYAMDAVRARGIVVGSGLAMWRVLR